MMEAFQIFPLWEMIVYRLMKRRLRVDDTAFSINVFALKPVFVFVWTGPQSKDDYTLASKFSF